MSLEQSGGEDAANHADDDDAGAGGIGEDCLSALPDDILVLILLRLRTTCAARTSVLSRRWRHFWTLLPEFMFPCIDAHRLSSILSANEVPVRLRTLIVSHRDASPESLAAWLPVAARRIYGVLVVQNIVSDTGAADGGEMEAEASQGGTIELPCFENATRIDLLLEFLSLSVPPAGVFARLAHLTLLRVRFYGPGKLGDAVSSPRCPCLQELLIINVKGLDAITINSESLQLLHLQSIHGVRQITIMAPALRDFVLFSCFFPDENEPVVDLWAPQLKSLKWKDPYDQSSVDLGSMEHLETLHTSFAVYEIDGFTDNSACLMLLSRFESIKNLGLTLLYPKEIDDFEYLMEGLTLFPKVTFLQLTVKAEGHSIGASSFHVLKFCSGINRLKLVLSYALEACSSDCICDEQINWKTEEISLNHLQELEIEGFRAFEHDFAFVMRLLNWVPVLKMMTMTFNCSESMAKEFVQMLPGFSRPGVRMKFYIYQNFKRVSFAPED